MVVCDYGMDTALVYWMGSRKCNHLSEKGPKPGRLVLYWISQSYVLNDYLTHASSFRGRI